MIGGFGEPEQTSCSRAGCHSRAVVAVNWRNPKIHDISRVKVWLACAEHSDYLRDFLEARNFPVRVGEIGGDVPPLESTSGTTL